MATDKVEWYDPLPDNCPPPEAIQPNNEVFYRLADSIPPVEKDFCSKWSLHPHRNYNDVGECVAKACSLFSRYKDCDTLRKLSIHKNQKIVQFTLPPESGLILKSRHHHYSWWRIRGFDPIRNCIEAVPG